MLQDLVESRSLARRTVRANWGLLVAAFTDDTAGVRWYLHADTGEIVRVSEVDGATGSLLDEGYIGIERARSKEQYRWMQRYIAALADRGLASELAHAIAGKQAFQRFKAVLAAHPRRTDDWCEFRSRELSRYMHAWLRAHGFVIPRDAPPPPPSIDPNEPCEPPSPRRLQLDAVLEELTAPDLDSLLALAELLHLNAAARRRAAG